MSDRIEVVQITYPALEAKVRELETERDEALAKLAASEKDWRDGTRIVELRAERDDLRRLAEHRGAEMDKLQAKLAVAEENLSRVQAHLSERALECKRLEGLMHGTEKQLYREVSELQAKLTVALGDREAAVAERDLAVVRRHGAEEQRDAAQAQVCKLREALASIKTGHEGQHLNWDPKHSYCFVCSPAKRVLEETK